jgi:hypothetical protein
MTTQYVGDWDAKRQQQAFRGWKMHSIYRIVPYRTVESSCAYVGLMNIYSTFSICTNTTRSACLAFQRNAMT